VAGEGDLVDVGMADHRRSSGFAVAVEDVDDAVGEAGLQGELGQLDAGDRGLLGQLHDDGVAAGEGGPHFQASIISGKFQGMICPTTPTGCRSV